MVHSKRSLYPAGQLSPARKEKKYMEYELKNTFNTVVRAEKECDVYCPICHKLLHVEAGQVIPRCCGKVMQVMD